jgi:hypothetical protein
MKDLPALSFKPFEGGFFDRRFCELCIAHH